MTIDLHAARQLMVETQVRPNDVTDPGIQAAMRAVPREAFCGANGHLAYADCEVEYAPGLYLLRPRDVGKLLQAVKPRPGERALAIAAPYAAAVMEHIGLAVDRIAHDQDPQGAYDVIVCEGSVTTAPASWTAALAADGRLGVIEREGVAGRARVYLRTGDGFGRRDAFDAGPPVLPGYEKKPEFSF